MEPRDVDGDPHDCHEWLAGPPFPPGRPSCRQVDIDPGGEHILAVWGDQIAVHRASTGAKVVDDFTPDEGLLTARFNGDGTRIAVGTRDDRVLLLDWRRAMVQARTTRLRDYVFQLRRVPGDPAHLAGVTRSNELLLFDGATLELIRVILSREAVYEGSGGMTVSPDGGWIYLASGRRLRCFDVGGHLSWQREMADPEATGRLRNPAASPDGKWLGATTSRGVVLLDASSGELLERSDCFPYQGIRYPGMPGEGLSWPTRAAFSRDGRFLALAAPNGQLMLLDPRSLRVLRTMSRAHLAWIEDLVWFEDGRLLLGRSDDRLVVWSADADRCLLEVPVSGSVASRPTVVDNRGG